MPQCVYVVGMCTTIHYVVGMCTTRMVYMHYNMHSLYASLGVPDPEGTKAIGISWVYLNLAVTEGSVAVPLRHQAGSLPKPLQELTVPFDISMR